MDSDTARRLDDIAGAVAGLSDEGSDVVFEREADYLAFWRKACAGENDPWAVAVLGGGLADRLAWVFAAGYQAAIRCCFDVPDGWSALAVSEAPDDPQRPGVRQSGDGLTGWKTWVAGVSSLSSLIVSVPDPEREEVRLALLQPGATGLNLQAPDTPASFLTELSQGRAILSGVHADHWLPSEMLKRFRTAEACGVVTALCSMLWLRAEVTSAREFVARSRDLGLLAREQPDRAERKAFLADVATWTREIDTAIWAGVPGFDRDRRLLAMMLPDLR